MFLGSRRLLSAVIAFAVLVVCSEVEVTFAQFQYGPAGAPLISDPTKETNYWNGIVNKPPQTEALQLAELQQANQVRESVSKRLRDIAPYADNKELGIALFDLDKLMRQIEQLSCDTKASEIDRLSNEIKAAGQRAYRLLVFEAQSQAYSWNNIAYAIAFPPTAHTATPTPPSAPKPPFPCEALKTAVRNLTPVQGVRDYDKSVRDVYAKEKAELDVVLEAVRKATSAIQEKLNTPSSQQQLTNYLWALILIIGLLSLASVLSVKYFSEEIQKEWVNSGQVIQFVTVMLLLSVILVLGLAGILKEETLGTLLGGVGGYVLSQGVGRAVAQAVGRQRNEGELPRRG